MPNNTFNITQPNLVQELSDRTQESSFVDLNQNQPYTTLDYQIYEDTTGNSTENFIIERQNYNNTIEITLSEPNPQPTSNISIIEIKTLNPPQNINNVTQMDTASLFSKSFSENAADKSYLAIGDDSSNSQEVDEHLQTSMMLSPKSDSDMEANETDLKSLNWLQNYTNFMSGKLKVYSSLELPQIKSLQPTIKSNKSTFCGFCPSMA